MTTSNTREDFVLLLKSIVGIESSVIIHQMNRDTLLNKIRKQIIATFYNIFGIMTETPHEGMVEIVKEVNKTDSPDKSVDGIDK